MITVSLDIHRLSQSVRLLVFACTQYTVQKVGHWAFVFRRILTDFVIGLCYI